MGTLAEERGEGINPHLIIDFLKKRFYLFMFRERGREGEREGENISVREIHHRVAFCTPLTVDLAHNPGMRSDWESNW